MDSIPSALTGKGTATRRRLIEFSARMELDHMTQMTAVIQQLQKEPARAAREVAHLDAALAALHGAGGKRSGTRTLSAAARERTAAAQRAQWAKLKGEGGQGAKMAGKPMKRTMSAGARRKIAAAQRARWAKVKAGRKTA